MHHTLSLIGDPSTQQVAPPIHRESVATTQHGTLITFVIVARKKEERERGTASAVVHTFAQTTLVFCLSEVPGFHFLE